MFIQAMTDKTDYDANQCSIVILFNAGGCRTWFGQLVCAERLQKGNSHERHTAIMELSDFELEKNWPKFGTN